MRTIKVELNAAIDATNSVSVSTEVIIEDDLQVEEAGRDARAALDAFLVAYSEGSA